MYTDMSDIPGHSLIATHVDKHFDGHVGDGMMKYLDLDGRTAAGGSSVVENRLVPQRRPPQPPPTLIADNNQQYEES